MIETDEEGTSAAQDANRAASRPISMSSTSSGTVVPIVPYSWDQVPIVCAGDSASTAPHHAGQEAQPGEQKADHNMPFSRARWAAAVRLWTSNLRMADRR